MRIMNPKSKFMFTPNTRKSNNRYTAFKSGKHRYVLTSNGYLFKLPPGGYNNLKNAQIVAYMSHGVRRN